jgi:hypothetical protein
VQYGTNQARGESQAAHNNDRDHVVNFRKPFKNPYAIEWAERQEIKKTSIKDAFDEETIATKASQSERTIQRDIAALRSMGLILVRFGYDESGKRFASEITLLAEQTESRLPAKT